jgi:Tripartite tricarboxylate transporter family receptor
MALVLCAGTGQRPRLLPSLPAGGIVGKQQVARASPDGYTLVVSGLGSFIISPVFTPVPFDRDFTHIVHLGDFRTLSDLVTYAAPVTYGTTSTGSQTQLHNERFQTQAGIKMTTDRIDLVCIVGPANMPRYTPRACGRVRPSVFRLRSA